MKRKSKKKRFRSPFKTFLLWATALTAASTCGLVWWLELAWLPAYLVGVNFSTVIFYGYDKLAARRQYLRVPEKALHLLAFAGGTPGAFLAQGLFRHKTAKGSFRIAFWLLAALQAALIGWAVWYFR